MRHFKHEGLWYESLQDGIFYPSLMSRGPAQAKKGGERAAGVGGGGVVRRAAEERGGGGGEGGEEEGGGEAGGSSLYETTLPSTYSPTYLPTWRKGLDGANNNACWPTNCTPTHK